MPVKEDHEKILKKLLELGANIHAKDVAGYTPLHHCLTCVSNSVTLRMARELLKAGADPNTKNRFGSSPLFEPVQAANMESINILLEFGADPDLVDNDGVRCSNMGNSKITELFSKTDKKKIKEARAAAKEKAGGCLWLCKVCQVDRDTKRCTGCYMVWYCGQKCQHEDWSDHKEECTITKKQFKEVVLLKEDNTVMSRVSKKSYTTNVGDLPTKKHFVVKVQLNASTHDSLLLYNKDKSLIGQFYREKQEDIFDMLVKSIKEKGCRGGLKGFFYAIYSQKDDKVNILKVNPVKILPPENW